MDARQCVSVDIAVKSISSFSAIQPALSGAVHECDDFLTDTLYEQLADFAI